MQLKFSASIERSVTITFLKILYRALNTVKKGDCETKLCIFFLVREVKRTKTYKLDLFVIMFFVNQKNDLLAWKTVVLVGSLKKRLFKICTQQILIKLSNLLMNLSALAVPTHQVKKETHFLWWKNALKSDGVCILLKILVFNYSNFPNYSNLNVKIFVLLCVPKINKTDWVKRFYLLEAAWLKNSRVDRMFSSERLIYIKFSQ